MAKRRMFIETLKLPISITWTQELVDDGAGGTDFYIRVTPHINLGGKANTPRLVVDKLGGAAPSLRAAAGYNSYVQQFKEQLKAETLKKVKEHSKEDIKEELRKLNSAQRQQGATKTTTVGANHTMALERQRIAREDEELKARMRKEEEEARKATAEATKKMMEEASEEDLAFMEQLKHGVKAGYSSILKELKETKSYDEDEEY